VLSKVTVGSVPKNKPLGFSATAGIYVRLQAYVNQTKFSKSSWAVNESVYMVDGRWQNVLRNDQCTRVRWMEVSTYINLGQEQREP
jgi:hypothetical protein